MPEILEQQGIGHFIERSLKLEKVTPHLKSWQEAIKILHEPVKEVSIGIVGKYVAMPDAYLSLMEALTHAGLTHKTRVNTTWVNSEDVAEGNLQELDKFDGILVPGGFGMRGIEGKVRAAGYAREQGCSFSWHLPRNASSSN